MDEQVVDNQGQPAPEENPYAQAMAEAAGRTETTPADEQVPSEEPEVETDEGQGDETLPEPEDEGTVDGENPYGKFKDPNALYEAYQNLERKLGQRDEYSRAGQDIVDIAQSLGLSNEELYQRIIGKQATQEAAPSDEKPWYAGVNPGNEEQNKAFFQSFMANPLETLSRIQAQAVQEAEAKASEKYRRESETDRIRQAMNQEWDNAVKEYPDLKVEDSPLRRAVAELQKESNYQMPASRAAKLASLMLNETELNKQRSIVAKREEAFKAKAGGFTGKSVGTPSGIVSSYAEAIEMGKRKLGVSG